jgi:hypothetical protein
VRPGDQIEVFNWKTPGWNGRRGVVTKVDAKYIWVRFEDWSPTDVRFDKEDSQNLRVIP